MYNATMTPMATGKRKLMPDVKKSAHKNTS